MRCVLFALCCVLASTNARAQESEAERLFQEGQRLFEAGEIERACTTFEQSLSRARTAGTLLNLARCHAAQGRTASAWSEYREAAAAAEGSGQQDRADGARKLAAELEPDLAKLTVTASVDLTVTRDGKSIELGKAVPVDPGDHLIEASAPGYRSWKNTVHVNAKQALTVDIPALAALRAPPPAPPPAEDTKPTGLSGTGIAGVALATVGFVALIPGIALGVITLNDVSDAEADEALCGPDKECTALGREQIDAAETKGIASSVLLAAGGAALAVGILLVVIDTQRDADQESALVTPFIAPDGAGLLLDMIF